jgi:hypothetical protein
VLKTIDLSIKLSIFLFKSIDLSIKSIDLSIIKIEPVFLNVYRTIDLSIIEPGYSDNYRFIDIEP